MDKDLRRMLTPEEQKKLDSMTSTEDITNLLMSALPLLVTLAAIGWVKDRLGFQHKIDKGIEHAKSMNVNRRLRVVCGYCDGMYDYQANSCSHCGGSRVHGKPVWINEEGEIQ